MKDLQVPTTVIRAALEERGWTVESVHESEDWWYRERWQVRSAWSPQDQTAHLTFLTDPEDEHPGKDHLSYRDVWAVAATATVPTSRMDFPEQKHLLPLKGQWRGGVPGLIDFLHRLRSESAI